MPGFADSIINLGVSDEMTFRQRSRVRIFNSSSIIILGICIFYTFYGFFIEMYLAGFLTGIEGLCVLSTFFLVRAGKAVTAYHISFLSGFAFLSGFSLLYGEVSMTHIFLLFLPVATVILFDNKRLIVGYFLLCVLSLIALKIVFYYVQPVYENVPHVWMFSVMNIFFTTILIFLGVKLFKNENTKFQDQINHQNEMLEEKNKDILSSIQYAKRIQGALITQEQVFRQLFPEHFIFFKPKDIVSGDFYWVQPLDDGSMLICIGDCTGHGVPGAFMTLLSISFLNEITAERKILRTDLVFNETRKELIRCLNPGSSIKEGRDGFDGILIHLNKERTKIQYTGANNPLWLIQNGKLKVIEPDRFPVGLHEGEQKDFNSQFIEIAKGDTIYLFTDGFSDQFGGTKGKKFKVKQLQEKIIGLQSLDLDAQKRDIESSFESWRGDLEQVDDVTLIGIKV